MSRALVLGGGMAGMLSAAVLAEHVDEVVVLESDVYPAAPGPRKGLPQAYQNHMLMGGGAQAVDRVLPGTIDALIAAGAHRRSIGDRFLILTAEGWSERFRTEPFVLNSSRHLVDHVVRQQVLRDPKIMVEEGVTVTGLRGDRDAITGVDADGGRRGFDADFVVDATGARSKAPQWLSGLGLPMVEEQFLDAGLAYAGRWYELPDGAGADFPGVLIQAEPATGRPGRGAALMPNEDGRWIVALMGTRGAHPPHDERGFLEYALSLRHPIIGNILSAARPLGTIRSSRATANRRRFFERMRLPANFVAIGDAVTVVSPNYATGMSVAALGALALRERLARTGLGRGSVAKAQTAIAKAGALPWQMALGNDRWFPGVETNVRMERLFGMDLSGVLGPFQQRMTARWQRTAASNFAMSRVTHEMTALTGSPAQMMSPRLMWSLIRGPQRPPLTAPAAIAQFPEFGELPYPSAADLPVERAR
ncbi:2-polyprenyl-6-methoxyphenol hydroxylase-like FAD-dependent oxidoreductase [Nocardia tenerifensis]|uniref:2-polyprenyl-6-methoxyphenol hydroxylase-like FAD-dependent oxidoreductase n=1 Tax=Nocardia tenerifensis TaxID=228006 RepID=A0A318KEX0_9NOCA|nr:FAD-dependent monooxygenase [Nocardia tenerifensis]PXX71485.1 2-polyprenyl-6-methoxyphenol hydroxylase-like FAD-dependent oxidoreductase [Nocardia tenerifensis]